MGDDALYPHLAASSDDPQRDFTTVSNQNFAKHSHMRRGPFGIPFVGLFKSSFFVLPTPGKREKVGTPHTPPRGGRPLPHRSVGFARHTLPSPLEPRFSRLLPGIVYAYYITLIT